MFGDFRAWRRTLFTIDFPALAFLLTSYLDCILVGWLFVWLVGWLFDLKNFDCPLGQKGRLIMKSIFNKVKNLDVVFGNEIDGKTYDLEKVVTLPLQTEKARLAKFDISTGNVKFTYVSLELAHVNTSKFADCFKRYWYYLATQGIEKAYSEYVAAQAETVEEKTTMKIVQSRYDEYMRIGQVFAKDIADVPETVRNFVCACFRSPDKAYSETIRNYAGAIAKAIKNAPIDEKTDDVNLKEVRNAGNKLCKEIFKESEGVCEKYTFNCNHALASDLYSVFYKWRNTDKDGKVVRIYNKPVALVSECVMACMENLQANAKKQEPKQEPKKEPKQEPKKGAKKGAKQEAKKGAKQEPKQEVKQEVKQEPKQEAKHEVK